MRSTSHEVSITTTKAITTTQIDDNGNTIIRTTDLAYIKTLSYVAIAVNEIRTTQANTPLLVDTILGGDSYLSLFDPIAN